jgi:DNA-directed RNA polymerase alpha subunit
VKNDTLDNMTVTTQHVISDNPTVVCVGNSEDVGIAPLPIVKLAPKQHIKFTGIACKGNGNEHAKFSPICICTCRYYVDENADPLTKHIQSDEPTEFVFEIETVKSMKAKTALVMSIDILQKKIKQFERSLDYIKM